MTLADIPGRAEQVATFDVIYGEIEDANVGPCLLVTDDGRAEATLCMASGAEVVLSTAGDANAASILSEARRYGTSALYEVLAIFPRHASAMRSRVTVRQRLYLSSIQMPQGETLWVDVAEDVLVTENLADASQTQITAHFAQEFLALSDVPLSPNARLAFVVLTGTDASSPADSAGMQVWSSKRVANLRRDGGVLRCISVHRHNGLRQNASTFRLMRGEVGFASGRYVAAQRSLSAKVVLQAMERPDSYLAGWRRYQSMERDYAFQKARTLGSLAYNGSDTEAAGELGLRITFHLREPLPDDYFGRTIDLDAATAPLVEDGVQGFDFPDDLKRAGEATMPNSNKNTVRRVVTYLPTPEDPKNLPPKAGYLMPSLLGDKRRLERREEALSILTGAAVQEPRWHKSRVQTPVASELHTLAELLETGRAPMVRVPLEPPLTQHVREKLGRELTPDQQEALSIALNTPDMAVIQGPPGTGKTTLIRALVLRIMEISQNRGGTPARILVTSYQQDAVDNAIQGIEVSGLPPLRIGGKSGQSPAERNTNLYKWIDERQKYCDVILNELPGDEERSLADSITRRIDHFRFSNNARNFEVAHAARELAQWVIEQSGEHLTTPRLREIQELLRRPLLHASDVSLGDDAARGLRERLATILDMQRITLEAFADDGYVRAVRLQRFLSQFASELGEVAAETITAVAAVTRDVGGTLDPDTWRGYLEALNSLSAEPSNGREATDDKNCTLWIESLLEALSGVAQDLHVHAAQGFGAIHDAIAAFRDEIADIKQTKAMVTSYGEVVAGTCQQIANAGESYDVVIIDEAARATPLDLLIPMVRGKKIILVGDQKQLPQVVEEHIVQEIILTQSEGQPASLRRSLFEHLFDLFRQSADGTQPVRAFRLKTGFRMHPVISRLVSDLFYEGEVKAGCTPQEREHGLPLYGGAPVAWIDVAQRYPMEDGGQSKARSVEADIVIAEAKRILSFRPDFTVGIITFYERQASLIRAGISDLPHELRQNLAAGTVDSFQGKEFDVVLLSTVRSNAERGTTPEALRRRVGFLALPSRLCVALSRGRRLLIVCGDSETIAPAVPALQKVLSWCVAGEDGYYEAR